MAEVPPWVDALKISHDDFREWLEIFPSPDFILSWAIESKRVDEQAYIKWASRYYKLPIVKNDFFQKPPPVEMWKKYLHGPWGPTMLPLYEWKDTLFVGVLEPKSFAFDNRKVQFVLSPSTAQSPWWQAYARLRKETVPATPPAVEEKLTPPPLPEPAPPEAVAPVAPVAPKPEPLKPVEEITISVVANKVAPKPVDEPFPFSKKQTATPEPAHVGEYTSIAPAAPETYVGEKKVDIMQVIDRPITPLGLEEHEELPEEGAPQEISIHSKNPTEKSQVSEIKAVPEMQAHPPPPPPPPIERVVETPIQMPQDSVVAIDLGMPTETVVAPMPPLPPPPVEDSQAAIDLGMPTETVVAPMPPLPPPPVEDSQAAIDLGLPTETVMAPMPPPPPPPPPAESVASTPLPPTPPEQEASQVAELLKPEKKIDLSPPAPEKKKTKLSVNASRVDNSVGFDHLKAPDIPRSITPEGITFELADLAPPEPPSEKLPEDLMPSGLDVGLEIVRANVNMNNPDGLLTAEVPSVDLGKLENLITDEVEVELPELDYEKQQTLFEDLVTSVRNSNLAPSHQGSTPPAAVNPENPDEIVFNGIPEGPIKSTFDKLRSTYEKGMVLLRQEGRMRPYQWDSTWALDLREKGDVELAIASIFKIVVESKHPFHGYARPSLPNDRFFKKWNQNKYPALVTALPLKAHDEVFGILLAVTSQENVLGKVNLGDMEKIAEELSAELAKAIGVAA